MEDYKIIIAFILSITGIAIIGILTFSFENNHKFSVTEQCLNGYVFYLDIYNGNITQVFEIVDGKSLPKVCKGE